MKYRIKVLKLNQRQTLYYNENTFNKLFNDYHLRNRKKEKLKNFYLMNESELYPFCPKFTHSGYFHFTPRVFPSVDNFGKKYYSINKFPLYNTNYFKKRNTTENYKNQEENIRFPKYNRKSISSRINQDINDQISHYLTNYKKSNRPITLYKPNSNQRNFFNKNNSERKSFIKSNISLTNNEKIIKNKNNKYNSNKSLNPSSLSGVDQLKTNYTIYPKNNNIKSGNNILSNVNSVSSRINDTNNNSHFLNGIKMISGVNEYYYDLNNGNNKQNSNKGDVSIQSISDSKILELAGKYVNDEDNSEENYQMNNIIYNKKKYINKKI